MPGTRRWKDCAGHWPTGPESCGNCNVADGCGRCCATVGSRSHVPPGVGVSAKATRFGSARELIPKAGKPAAAETGRAKERRS